MMRYILYTNLDTLLEWNATLGLRLGQFGLVYFVKASQTTFLTAQIHPKPTHNHFDKRQPRLPISSRANKPPTAARPA
jgi:hypothetical protein